MKLCERMVARCRRTTGTCCSTRGTGAGQRTCCGRWTSKQCSLRTSKTTGSRLSTLGTVSACMRACVWWREGVLVTPCRGWCVYAWYVRARKPCQLVSCPRRATIYDDNTTSYILMMPRCGLCGRVYGGAQPRLTTLLMTARISFSQHPIRLHESALSVSRAFFRSGASLCPLHLHVLVLCRSMCVSSSIGWKRAACVCEPWDRALEPTRTSLADARLPRPVRVRMCVCARVCVCLCVCACLCVCVSFQAGAGDPSKWTDLLPQRTAVLEFACAVGGDFIMTEQV